MKDCTLAFLVGGTICAFGEGFKLILSSCGLQDDAVSKWIPIVLIFLSCLFTGIGWYDKLAAFAGAGTLVPITGFANAMASPAIDNKSEGFVMGLGAKLFVICGSVIAYGTLCSIVLGCLMVILSFFGIRIADMI